MELVRKTIIGFLLGIGSYGVLVELFGVFFSEDILSYSLGLLYGVIVAILIFLHMARGLNRALDLPQEKAEKYARKQAFLRLAMMLVALLVVLRIPKLHFIAAVLGLLGLKIGSLFAPFFLKRIYPQDFVTKDADMGI